MTDRQELAARLRQIEGVAEVHESGADFLPVRLDIDPADSKALREIMLARHDILVRDISDKIADGRCYLRVAVRLSEENQRFAESLATALAECRAPRVVPIRKGDRT
jgi:histidinol-phosphate/aromatic aminotransferase/cobyric acid decarboxylase-like protein